jgi:hypothetical protein
MVALLTLAGQAAAQDEASPIDQISASPADVGGVTWTIEQDELARLYPAVARAIASPYFLIDVADEEQLSTQTFFEEMQRREAAAIDVEGALYTVAISIASGGMPPAPEDAPDATSHGEVPDATSHSATADGSASTPLLVGGLVGVAALSGLVGVGGVGVAVLALRHK